MKAKNLTRNFGKNVGFFAEGSDFNEISSSIETTGMIVMTDMTTETTDMTVEEEDSVVNDKISNNKGSQYLFYVCLGGGVALVVIILVFGVYCWKKNFFSISKTVSKIVIIFINN